ncbi:MAG: hypothetical protein JNL32_02830 [Candidatus Kapabacteria bacterium]|nr:hypothetical protein [Candidatus Kapabacteria bacterium]
MLLSVIAISIVTAVAALGQVPAGDNPIPRPPKLLKPEEAIKKDTMQRAVELDSTYLPGGTSPYSSYQDSSYIRALRLSIAPSIRFAIDAQRSLTNLEIVRRRYVETPWQAAMRNMQIPDKYFVPDGAEVVNRQIAIANATSAPIFRPAQIGTMSATFEQIGSFLGISEDVTPTLRYEVQESPKIVTIVVYSTTAKVIATIFNKVQQPGKYEITWNLKDERGNELMDGDYVIEARVGDSRHFRKRVVIGSK